MGRESVPAVAEAGGPVVELRKHKTRVGGVRANKRRLVLEGLLALAGGVADERLLGAVLVVHDLRVSKNLVVSSTSSAQVRN